MNMPLELGIDLGAKLLGAKSYASKRILILEEERYRFQASISDLSNSDIKAHEGKPEEVVRAVRDWLVQEAKVSDQSASYVWSQFNFFMAETYDSLKARNYSDEDISRLPAQELFGYMEKWLKKTPNLH